MEMNLKRFKFIAIIIISGVMLTIIMYSNNNKVNINYDPLIRVIIRQQVQDKEYRFTIMNGGGFELIIGKKNNSEEIGSYYQMERVDCIMYGNVKERINDYESVISKLSENVSLSNIMVYDDNEMAVQAGRKEYYFPTTSGLAYYMNGYTEEGDLIESLIDTLQDSLPIYFDLRKDMHDIRDY